LALTPPMQTHNYFFIQAFAAELSLLLENKKLIRCYSNQTESLVLAFSTEQQLQLELTPSQLYFAIQATPQHPQKQYNNRFQAIHNQVITKIEGVTGDRVLCFRFANNYSLVITFFGRKSNLFLFADNQAFPVEIWRNSLLSDKSKTLDSLLSGPSLPAFPCSVSQLSFIPSEIQPYFPPTLESKEALYALIPFVNLKLNWNFDPENSEKGLQLIEKNATKQSVLQTLKSYMDRCLPIERNAERKNQLNKSISQALHKHKTALQAVQNRLHSIETQRSQKEIADLILSHLYAFETKTQNVSIVDYYRENAPMLISLPNETSAVAYAAKLYKKHKGVGDEKRVLIEKANRLSSEILRLEAALAELDKQESNKEILRFEKKENAKQQQQTLQKQLPYHELEVEGFIIRIGRSAESNDEMLRNHTHKNDIWLHAKDYAGSHVIIKTQGQTQGVSSHVLQQAANWAAFYSKGKNQGLLPVIYTERKHVRKNKRLRAGQVIVDKERIIMAKPEKPQLPLH